jgi:hypothetical protein
MNVAPTKGNQPDRAVKRDFDRQLVLRHELTIVSCNKAIALYLTTIETIIAYEIF